MRLCALVVSLLLFAVPLCAQEGPQAKADQLIDRISKRPDKAWDYAFSLRSLTKGEEGSKVTPVLERGLDHESEHVQLVCARILLATGATEVALDALARLLRSDDDRVIEAVAMLIADESPEHDGLADKVNDAWSQSQKRGAGARVALCEALLALTGQQLARDQLNEFLGSGDHNLVARAALALSRTGSTAANARLAGIAREPGDLGRLARLGREITATNQAIEDHRTGKAGVVADRMAAVQVRAIKQHYVDDHFWYGEEQQKLNNEDLVDNACRAMSVAFDRYGAYMTRAEIDKMNEDQEGRYVGIGAHVNQGEDGIIFITQPIYEGPAYAAGVRTGDKLVGVIDRDGNRVDLTKAALEDGVKLVRGPEGSTAKIFVRRRGVDKELSFEIKRQSVRVDTALEEMLPGKIGYLRLTRFGANSDTDLVESLQNLRKQGMQQLILDLRGNGGGQMDAVLNICDQFIPEGKRICQTGGRFEPWKGMQPPNVSKGGEFNEITMVVLIDGESASGSEMLSGALKDHERATIIGRQTFGKGVGQSFFAVTGSGGQRVLKTTSFRYYLPLGSCPDRAEAGGVKPNIHVDADYLQAWEVYAIDKLRKSGKLDEYLDLHYRGEGKAALMKLASFDGLQTQAWPQFEDFYTALGTRLDRDDVRRELRFALRTRVQDDRGAEFTQNFQEDPVLLRGVTELLAKAGKSPDSIPEYQAVIKK